MEFTQRTKTIKIDRKRVKLDIIATSGSSNFDRLRPIHYKDADFIIICYRDGSSYSFKNVEERWIPEVKKINKNATILLVATKSDLTPNGFTFDQDKIKNIQEKLGIRQHIKCSAVNGFNINTLFLTVAHYHLDSAPKRRSLTMKINNQVNTLIHRTTKQQQLFKR